MWPHINNSMYGNDFEIKVMRNTCKNHRAGKIGFPSKSSSQVRGCLSPTAIIRRDVFSLLSSLTPSPALSARYPLPALPRLVSRGFSKQLAAGWRRQERAEPRCVPVLQRVMQRLRALRPGSSAAAAPGQAAMSAQPERTGHHGHFRRKSDSQTHSWKLTFSTWAAKSLATSLAFGF